MSGTPPAAAVADSRDLIRLTDVWMSYPLPVRWRDLPLLPFRSRARVPALTGADLSLRPGDRLGILGPNGAGKSTLARLLAGILYPTRGSVFVDGADTRTENSRARSKIGLVINQERSFYWRLSGHENLEFFGALENLVGAQLQDRIQQLLKLVGLAAAAPHRVAGYSSGMKQRLAIARALLPDPEVLVLDEPTRSLDPLGAADMRRLLSEMFSRSARRTLVVATNVLQDIPTLCDRVIVLHRGRFVGSLDVDERADSGIADFYRQCLGSDASLPRREAP